MSSLYKGRETPIASVDSRRLATCPQSQPNRLSSSAPSRRVRAAVRPAAPSRSLSDGLARAANAVAQIASMPSRWSRTQAAELYKYLRSLRFFIRQPRLSAPVLGKLSQTIRGLDYGLRYRDVTANDFTACKNHYPASETNPLRYFFESRNSGRGIWKWDHYFDIYHHHFRKFVGTNVNILEIGIYAGGSLEMWRHYFGPGCHVYGIDIEEACKVYANEYTDIFVGDQEDRGFWQKFKQSVPHIDIVIDDGGHSSQQQIVTLEEMLPHLRPGGIYVCEDVHGISKGFNSFAHGLVSNLNAMTPAEPTSGSVAGMGSTSGSIPSQFQKWIRSIHFYPYVIVVEKTHQPLCAFASRRRGTEWQPFGLSRASDIGSPPT